MEVRDKNGKLLKVGDKVKFFVGQSKVDPFCYWQEGYVCLDNGILSIREDLNKDGNDGLWSAFNKQELEILEEKPTTNNN